MRTSIHESSMVADFAATRQGLITGNNDLFLRKWYEVSVASIGFGCKSRGDAKGSMKRWFPCVKGGPFRKWFGNNEHVVNWESDGESIKGYTDRNGRLLSRPQNLDYYFREGLSWSTLTIGTFSMRYCPAGFVFESKGSMCFANNISQQSYLLAYFNTKLVNEFLRASSPTLDYHEGPVARLPMRFDQADKVVQLAEEAVRISRSDWDSFESSWDFQSFPWLSLPLKAPTLANSWQNWQSHATAQIKRMQELETENNRLFIEAYGLQDELTPEVPEDQITLARADLEADVKRLISYAIGCMMGRYRLDRPGLIYAHSGNERFWEIYGRGDRIQGTGDSKTGEDQKGTGVRGQGIARESDQEENNSGKDKGGEDGVAEFSGIGRLAEGDGSGGACLSGDAGVSERRNLQADESDSAGGSVDTVEHSRRLRTEIDGRVPEFSLGCTGVTGGDRDPDADRSSSEISYRGTGEAHSRIASGNIEDAHCPSVQASLTPDPCIL
jgi:hypothetical protein